MSRNLLDALRDPQFRSDVGRGLLSAGNRGVVAGLLGAPVDLTAMAMRPFGYRNDAPMMGSEWIGQKMQDAGLVSSNRNPLAEALAGVAVPGAAARAGPAMYAAETAALRNAMAAAPMNAATRGQGGAVVWHGSPHKFDKFDASRIGTGEGAQAYGHGLYLAESPSVAREYQRALGGASGGQLYKVDLPDPAIARMLDWDKPIAQQHENIRRLLPSLGTAENKALREEARMLKAAAQQSRDEAMYRQAAMLEARRTAGALPETQGQDAYKALMGAMGETPIRLTDTHGSFGTPGIAQWFRQQGVPGIRYLDGSSRGGAGSSSNFVIFPGEENLLSILERNGMPLR